VLRKAGLFQGVDPEDAEALSEQFEIFEAPRGTILFHEGEPGDSLYIVLGGKVKLGRRSSDGRENLVAIMGPADQFGELSIFDPGPRTATATVVTDARLARLPKPALQKWVQERPQIACSCCGSSLGDYAEQTPCSRT
jgi:cAMP-binding proteins - catabolite gene activator and regulatory subunit of cAMP-dependent protein kinases